MAFERVELGGGRVTLFRGDALEVLPTLADGSVDAVAGDPPAGISFMGKEWDNFGGRANGKAQEDRDAPHRGPGKGAQPFGYSGSELGTPSQRQAFIAFLSAALRECFRVAKPGARLLCWAIPRTSHWTGTAIEDAGWVIEDRICHLFGQGFPKAKSKLKPACEDWWLARKPSKKVPPLNIDGCRVGLLEARPLNRNNSIGYGGSDAQGLVSDGGNGRNGRWPANVTLSHLPECVPLGTKRVKGTNVPNGISRKETSGYEGGWGDREAHHFGDADGMETVEAWNCHPDCPVRMLDEQSGWQKSRRSILTSKPGAVNGAGLGLPSNTGVYGFDDDGGASRFFYCAKASKRDRNEGLEELPQRRGGAEQFDSRWKEGTGELRSPVRKNTHPTVKPTPLMRWLCRLITPPDGLVLDPFMGSGSTGKACAADGFRFVGIERDPDYFSIARRRVEAALAEEKQSLFSGVTA